MIDGAAIANRYNTEQCVKSYTRCLNRDNICGADFELCTTQTDFKKQAVLCDSTLARCQDEGKTQLFGDTIAAGKLEPKSEIEEAREVIEKRINSEKKEKEITLSKELD